MRWSLQERVTALTGAGSGIGRALALELAQRGCSLALADVDAARLAEVAAEVQVRGATVTTTTVDVRDRAALETWAADTAEHFGAVHVIVNNAGVAAVGPSDRLPLEDFEWVMDVNVWGVVHGTRAFMPHLQEADAGQVVNISSVFGLIAVPAHGAYNASKFAVRGFSEALAQELAIERSTVQVTCVHPGGVATDIARAARYRETGALLGEQDAIIEDFYKRLARTTPRQAARVIADGIAARRRRVLIGRDARLADVVQRVAPVGYQRLAVGIAGRFRRKCAGHGA